MKAQGIAALGIIVLALVVVGGSVFLANAHVMPVTQKVEQSIPDDHIPR